MFHDDDNPEYQNLAYWPTHGESKSKGVESDNDVTLTWTLDIHDQALFSNAGAAYDMLYELGRTPGKLW